MNEVKRKLKLCRETIRILSVGELERVQGGDSEPCASGHPTYCGTSGTRLLCAPPVEEAPPIQEE